MGRKKPNTPRSRVKNTLRQLWLRSRERAAALKKASYCCTECGIKQSTAKGHEVKLEVHHDPMVNWDGIVDLIIERLLQVPQYPLCKGCHKALHEKLKEDKDKGLFQ